MKYPDIPHIANNPNMEGQYLLKQNITYSVNTGEELKLTLFLPWNLQSGETEKSPKPLIVFVQGCGFKTPNLEFEIPQLAQIARAGYIVATVSHRNALEGHPFPAYLIDVKCAIRYLKRQAAEYGIDPERVAVWGTSSGGNAAMLVGLTADDPRYETKEHDGYSDSVNAVVSCFGPMEFDGLMPKGPVDRSMLPAILGKDRDLWPEVIREMSPLYRVEPGKTYPAFLLMHGTGDELVGIQQMVDMYHRLLDSGVTAFAYQVDGGRHENNFWSAEVYRVIGEFFAEYC